MKQENVIDRLYTSLASLEHSIQSARTTIERRGGVSPEIKSRLSSYDTILAKQRALADTLVDAMARGAWDEVGRQVELINGLSGMIRDDARAILTAIVKKSETTVSHEDQSNYC
jgi:hypothetical protein